MLPAEALVVLFGKFQADAGKTDFTDKRLNLCREQPDLFVAVTPSRDEVVVTFQGQPLGLARKVGSRLKNSYPRELVRDGKLPCYLRRWYDQWVTPI